MYQNKIIQTFSSITNASKTTNISIGAISACLTGKSKTSGGYVWKYSKL